ncbi:MAG: hypothetical protein RLO17_01680 [Cyclobacteriaceae bacterium]
MASSEPSFQIVAIQVDSFNLIPKSEMIQSLGELDNNMVFKFDSNFKFSANIKQHNIQLAIDFTGFLSKTVKEESIPCLSLITTFDFSISSFDKWTTDEKILIPSNVAKSLISVGFGTLRGIVHTKTADTYLPKILLPIMDLDKIKQQDLEFPLNPK